MKKLFATLMALVVLTFAAPATAQTHTVTANFGGPDGITGTAVLVMDDSTLAPSSSIGNVAANPGPDGPASVPAELISATLTFNNLSTAPATTTFNRSDLTGLFFRRNAVGNIDGFSFDGANTDGYVLKAVSRLQTQLNGNTLSVTAFNVPPPPAPAPIPIPTLSEWAMILLGVALAGAAALTIHRRRTA